MKRVTPLAHHSAHVLTKSMFMKIQRLPSSSRESLALPLGDSLVFVLFEDVILAFRLSEDQSGFV